MQIWLNTSPVHYSNGKECTNTLPPTAVITFSSSKVDTGQTQMCILKQTTPLHIQSFAYDRWLVCNSSGSGQLAILDSQAMLLLDQFRCPIALSEVLSALSDWSPEGIRE